MTSFKVHQLTRESMRDMWIRFMERRRCFAYGFGVDVQAFLELMMADDTVIYELGNFGGVLYFTQVLTEAQAAGAQEPVARVHVCVWDRAVMGQPEIATAVGLHFMATVRVRRLITEIPVWNQVAIQYARAAGMTKVGVLRQRVSLPSGKMVDSIVMDALVSDLERARQAGPPRRQRASVRLVAEGSHG